MVKASRVAPVMTVPARVKLDDFNSIPAKLNGTVTQTKRRGEARLRLIHPDDVQVQDTHWLVKPFLPVVWLALLTADGAAGTGTYACTLAAAMTLGQVGHITAPCDVR